MNLIIFNHLINLFNHFLLFYMQKPKKYKNISKITKRHAKYMKIAFKGP